MAKIVLTVCLLWKGDQILLALKKKGRMGVGYWNGPGGHVEEDDVSIEAAAHREMKEETGLNVLDMYKAGVVDCYFNNGKHCEVHIFGAHEFEGELRGTETDEPEWRLVSDIPNLRMWPGDRYWLDAFFKGKQFKARIHMNTERELVDPPPVVEEI